MNRHLYYLVYPFAFKFTWNWRLGYFFPRAYPTFRRWWGSHWAAKVGLWNPYARHRARNGWR